MVENLELTRSSEEKWRHSVQKMSWGYVRPISIGVGKDLHEISHCDKGGDSIDVQEKSQLRNGKGAKDGIDWLIMLLGSLAED